MRIAILYLALLTTTLNTFAQWEADRKLSTNESSAMTNENMGQCLVIRNDTIHVVWGDNIGGVPKIYYKRSSDGGTSWSNDTNLTNSPDRCDFSSVSISGPYVHVGFKDTVATKRLSAYRRSTDYGITWQTQQSLGEFYWWPSITSEGSNVYMALNSNTTGNSEVHFRRSTDNGLNWDPAIQISNATGRSEDPSITAAGGYVHMAWNDNREGIMNTYYRRSTNGGTTWEVETRLTNSTVFAYCPQIVASNADVDLVWGDRRNNGNDFNIYHRHSTDYGANWGAEERLTSVAYGGVYPSIVRSGSMVHLLSQGSGLYYMRSTNGGASWETQQTLVSSTNNPGMAFIRVSGGAVHIIWIDNRLGHNALYYKRNPTGNQSSSTNTITIGTVPTDNCQGKIFTIPFQITGTYLSDNVFTAQLSDATGNFTNPTVIGTLSSSGSGSINSIIPANIVPGTAYRIRVVSSSPAVISPDNGSNITINALPVAVINGSNNVCSNNNYFYYSNKITGQTSKWTATGGTIQGQSNSDSVLISWGKAGTGNLKLVKTVLTSGCTDSVSQTVTINSLPSATISGNFNVCSRNSYNYSSNIIAGSSHFWKVSGGTNQNSPSSDNIIIDWDTVSSGTITLITTITATGCTDSVKQVVTINPSPTVIINGTNAVCAKNYYLYSTNNISGTTIHWRAENGTISSSANSSTVSVLWGDFADGLLTLTKTNSIGCSDSSISYITIYPIPNPVINGPRTVCTNSIVSYTSEPSSDNSFKWSVEGGTIIGTSTNSIVNVNWINPGKGKVTCEETSANTDCRSSASISINIQYAPVKPSFTGPLTSCINEIKTYTALSSSSITNLWEVSGGEILGNNSGNNVQIRWTETGNGIINLVQTSLTTGCSDSVSQIITVNELPAITIIGPTETAQGSIQNYSCSANNILTYKWYVSGATITGADDKQFVVVNWGNGNAGSVKVIATNKDECTDSSTADVTLTITEVGNSSQSLTLVKLIPNPFSESTMIEVFSNNPKGMEMEIINSYGIIIRKINPNSSEAGYRNIEWDGLDGNGNQVSSGMYLIVIRSGELTKTIKATLIR